MKILACESQRRKINAIVENLIEWPNLGSEYIIELEMSEEKFLIFDRGISRGVTRR